MRVFAAVSLIAGVVGCTAAPEFPAPPAGSAIVTFAFAASGDTMDVLITDSATIARAEQRVETGVGAAMPLGPIVRGVGSDSRYPFHYVADEVRLVDLAMELCDGRPMRTPEAVDAFFEGATGNRHASRATWCPWGAQPIAVRRADQAAMSPRATRNAPGIR